MSRAVRDVAEQAVRAGLRPSRWMVAVMIAAHASNRTGVAWPSLVTLAEETGLGRRTVVRAIPDLEAAGIVAVERRRGRPNHYRIAVTIPPLVNVDFSPTGATQVAPPPEHTRGAKTEGDQCHPGGTRSSEVPKEKEAHAYPCCCDDCMATIEARRA